MTIKLVVDTSDVKEVEKRLGRLTDKAPNAIARALNRTMTNIKTNATKGAVREYHIKAKEVKDTLKEFKAHRSNLTAEVRASSKQRGLDRFKVTPKTVNHNRKSQLKIAVKKDGMKQVLGAFIVDLHGIKVFQRTGESKVQASKGRYKDRLNVKREPVERKFGPSVTQMLQNEKVSEDVMQKARDTYEKRLNHEINYILSRI